MSSLEAITVVLNLPAEEDRTISVFGYGAMGVALAGTFSAGTIKVQGSNDGQTWTDLPVYVRRVAQSGDEILTTGNYVSSVVSYQLAKLLLTGFSGNLVATISLSTKII